MAQIAVQLALAMYGARQAKKAEQKDKKMQRQAEAFEADRQRQINLTRSQVDQAFDSPQRQGQYADYADALRAYYGEQLGRKKTDASRGLKFALASSGLTGGSVDVDSGRRLGDEYSRGAIENERVTQRNLSGLKSADESSRLSLHELAMSGMNATTGLRRSAESMAGNLQTGYSEGQSQMIGDAYAATNDTYRRIQDRNETRRGYGITKRNTAWSDPLHDA